MNQNIAEKGSNSNNLILRQISIITDEPILKVEEVTERGLVNNVYIVTGENRKFVFRTDPEKEDLEEYKKEMWCSNQARNQGVLTPEIYKIGMHNNHPYMIMEYIDGKDGDHAQEQSAEIWETLGKYAKLIHQISISGYGGEMGEQGKFNDTWERFLTYNIDSLTPSDKAIEIKVFSKEESAQIKKLFESLRNKSLSFGLAHYDLAPKNTRVDNSGKIYLIDWGSAAVTPIPYLDIAEILDESLQDDSEEFKKFLEGYMMTYDQYLEIKEGIKIINLLVHMDKLRWAIDRRPDRIEHFKTIIRSKLDEFF